jgi:hypothetical protein
VTQVHRTSEKRVHRRLVIQNLTSIKGILIGPLIESIRFFTNVSESRRGKGRERGMILTAKSR